MLPVLALSLCAAVASPAPALDHLVSRIVTSYGGERAISGFKAFRETGTLESPRGSARTVRVLAPPDRLRVEITYEGGNGEVRVLDRRNSWRNGEPVEGPPRDAMVLQAARLDLPGLLLRNRDVLVDLGNVKRGGKTWRAIGIPMPGNLNVALTIDPKTARIVRSEGELPMGESQVRFATDYSDFRKVDGVLFAFHEVNYASGQQTGVTRLEKIELLEKVPEDSFLP